MSPTSFVDPNGLDNTDPCVFCIDNPRYFVKPWLMRDHADAVEQRKPAQEPFGQHGIVLRGDEEFGRTGYRPAGTPPALVVRVVRHNMRAWPAERRQARRHSDGKTTRSVTGSK